QISKDLNLPLVATNDLHYTHQHDSKHHEALLALQSGSKLSEPPYDEGGSRFAFSGNDYYLKSAGKCVQCSQNSPKLQTIPCSLPNSVKAALTPRLTTCPVSRPQRERTKLVG